ncbi:MAG: FKBP-type peptidyl-prolyl cis-trans isomerase [Marinilabiliaceae bacterium]|nr:FKBP-type peptidyl-prolyl cis-trans isomerase [Marinilabiliaceae bacterium]
MKKIDYIIIVALAFLHISCDNQVTQQNEDQQINQYIEAHHPGAEAEMNGLYIIHQTVTQGIAAMPGNQVIVDYEGRFLDGRVFDSSYDRQQPIAFVLGSGKVIAGWEQGIATMREGEKAEFIIPSFLAYGDRRVGPIAPNTPLVFSVTLVKVEP